MPVPDYVFDSCYSLIDLNSLSAFLKVNKHLPGIPSATDIANSNNEIDVNHFQMLLLQKIEELTLYILSQQKEIDSLKKTIIKE